jgi:hypothetical protein
VLRVVVLSGAGQKAFLLSMGFLLVFAGWMGWAWIRGPETQRERDEAQAVAKQDELRGTDRLRVVSQTPEWARRLRKKWLAAGRRGNQILNGSKE